MRSLRLQFLFFILLLLSNPAAPSGPASSWTRANGNNGATNSDHPRVRFQGRRRNARLKVSPVLIVVSGNCIVASHPYYLEKHLDISLTSDIYAAASRIRHFNSLLERRSLWFTTNRGMKLILLLYCGGSGTRHRSPVKRPAIIKMRRRRRKTKVENLLCRTQLSAAESEDVGK